MSFENIMNNVALVVNVFSLISLILDRTIGFIKISNFEHSVELKRKVTEIERSLVTCVTVPLRWEPMSPLVRHRVH
jgi:hypothetical protein